MDALTGTENHIYRKAGETKDRKMPRIKDDTTRPSPLETAGSRRSPHEGLSYKWPVRKGFEDATFMSQPDLFEMEDEDGRIYIHEEVIRDFAADQRRAVAGALDARKRQRAKVFKAHYP